MEISHTSLLLEGSSFVSCSVLKDVSVTDWRTEGGRERREEREGEERREGGRTEGGRGEERREERGRGERERRGALLLDNPFSYRASSRLRLDKCSDGCVWGENSRGWLVECWRGCRDMEREKERERWIIQSQDARGVKSKWTKLWG